MMHVGHFPCQPSKSEVPEMGHMGSASEQPAKSRLFEWYHQVTCCSPHLRELGGRVMNFLSKNKDLLHSEIFTN